MAKNWDPAAAWYSACVGEKGHYYHQTVVLPGALRLLEAKKMNSFLDLGCGQGVLLRHLPDTINYYGVDQSKSLIESAKKLTKRKNVHFAIADVTEEIPVDKWDFDGAAFILSLQNMANGAGAIATAGRHLKKGAKLLIVLNHPCFRIPRQSGWGVDEQAKLQYRRMNGYLSPQKIPIQVNPGKGKESEETYSYHHSISDYASWLSQSGFSITIMEEWCSDKKSEGAKARMEDRARKEFPLFLAILAERGG